MLVAHNARKMSGGKISTTKLSFTLPISCQICLEKVKEPVTCPNQHVFCNLCMEVWLERNKQCPTCRVDITPQSPVRRIIGGMSDTQSDEKRSPRTSKHLRRARLELLFSDYENEISELQREITCLQHSKEELRSRLLEEESKPGSSSSCSRCGSMQDLDSMLEMAKNLQEATKTFETMKEENKKFKLSNEKMFKDNDDLKRQNTLVKEEMHMRSPMKFGRLTVATLESRIETYEKQVTQLQRALEKNDKYTESLKEQLKNCSCAQKFENKTVDCLRSTDSMGTEFTDCHTSYLLEHDYTNYKTIPSHTECEKLPEDKQLLKADITDSATTFAIENILPDDLVSQAFNTAVNENSVDQSIFTNQFANSKSPFTPSTKFSRLSLMTSTSDPTMTFENTQSQHDDIKKEIDNESKGRTSSVKEQEIRVRSFTAQTMPPVESPDYKEKLEQIQDNLLQPITASANSLASSSGQNRNFSRRLTFEDEFRAAMQPESLDLGVVEENTQSSCADEMMSLLQSEDSMQSIDEGADTSDINRSNDNLRFIRPQSVLKFEDSLLHSGNELTESSSNPVLSSGHYANENFSKKKTTKEAKHEVSLSVVDAGGTRITTTKLSQSDRDIFTRPSSAPSRTFLLSGSRFSALRPLDPLGAETSGFQPVKCKSPSPMQIRHRRLTIPQTRSAVATKKEGIRCVVDGRSASPLLRLVSPDDVMSTNWKQSPDSSTEETSNLGSKSKDTISRVAILKRQNSMGKQYSASEIPNSLPIAREEIIAPPPRRSSRKQCLTDQNTKRMGDHSPEFVSPQKIQKMENKDAWK